MCSVRVKINFNSYTNACIREPQPIESNTDVDFNFN